MKSKFIIFLLSLVLLSSYAAGQGVINSDSRIKTLVYNENDVFSILTVFGYQSNIEFSKNEEITTISLGDKVGWQVVPSGRRLFIRAQEDGAHTNMTVITNKRAYQFDLKSSEDGELVPSEELSYVIRFYYPDEQNNQTPPSIAPLQSAEPIPTSSPRTPQITATPITPATPVTMTPPAAKEISAPVITGHLVPPTTAQAKSEKENRNFNYTFTGNPAYAPEKVYDDGKDTYVKLPAKYVFGAKFFSDAPKPKTPLNATRHAEEGYLIQDVHKTFTIMFNDGQSISVYNENMM